MPPFASAAPPSAEPTPAPSSSVQERGDLFTPGVRDPAAGLSGRWERELERRATILRASRGPSAILGLVGLLTELGGEIHSDRLVALLGEVIADRRHDPLVKAHAAFLLGKIDEAEGDRKAARAHFESAGFLLDWQIIGPFDNQGRARPDLSGRDRAF